MTAERILDLAWEWLGKDIRSGLALSPPSYRDRKLGDLGKPLASVLTAAAAIGAASTQDSVFRCIRKQEDPVTALEVAALRAASELPRDVTRGGAGFADLAADGAARLRARLARPQRASGDWSINRRAAAPATCAIPFAFSWRTRTGAPSSGRSPSSAGSTSTPGSTRPNCRSPT